MSSKDIRRPAAARADRTRRLLRRRRRTRQRRQARRATVIGVEVEVVADADMPRASVRDDGHGGADLTRGSGLVGLTDRVEALGGRLSMHSAPGAGTTVQIALSLTAASGPTSPR